MVPGRLGMLNSAAVKKERSGDQRGSGYGDGSSVSNSASSSSCSFSSSSSSIGNNSNDLDGKPSSSAGGDGGTGGVGCENCDGEEIQSSSKSTFDDAMDALEEALPIRRGISRFYNGKSMSFASLADASACASIKDITKPQNAYTRKRKNLLAHSLLWDKKPTSSSLLLRSHGGGISKRPTNPSTSMLAFAVAMTPSIDETSPDSGSSCKSFTPLFSPGRGSASAWRSFSVTDLQQCSNAVNCSSHNRMIVGPNKPDQVS